MMAIVLFAQKISSKNKIFKLKIKIQTSEAGCCLSLGVLQVRGKAPNVNAFVHNSFLDSNQAKN